ncbi:receptor-like protein kinase FERONIA [Tanacetum coccineum]
MEYEVAPHSGIPLRCQNFGGVTFGTQHGIIHQDVKSSNTLLDENWEAKISDFGLSKVGPTNLSLSSIDASVKGTFGYLDPEYFYTSKVTRKTDVYVLGFDHQQPWLLVRNFEKQEEHIPQQFIIDRQVKHKVFP